MCSFQQIFILVADYKPRQTYYYCQTMFSSIFATRDNLGYSRHSSPKNSPPRQQLKGEPYTRYPVPVAPRMQPHKLNPHSTIAQLDAENSAFAQKSEHKPSPHKSQSAAHKYRELNPGLMNVGRTINPNHYDQQNLYSEAEAVRRHGMNYRKKLMQRYNKQNMGTSRVGTSHRHCSIDHEREVKNWYEDRVNSMQAMHLSYLKQMQVKLAQQDRTLEEKQLLLGEMNKQWDLLASQALKKCFQA